MYFDLWSAVCFYSLICNLHGGWQTTEHICLCNLSYYPPVLKCFHVYFLKGNSSLNPLIFGGCVLQDCPIPMDNADKTKQSYQKGLFAAIEQIMDSQGLGRKSTHFAVSEEVILRLN